MPAQGLVRVVMQADARQLRAALNGAVGDSRRADQATRASATASEREKARATAAAERERTRTLERSTRERGRLEARAARESAQLERRRLSEQERLQRQRTREAQRSESQRAREYRQQMRAGNETGSAAMLGIGGAVLGATLTALTGALDAVTTRLQTIAGAVAARAGTMDVGQRTANAQDFELALARSSGEFFQGQDPAQTAASMAQLQEEILGVAQASAQSPTALLNVLSTMQTEFSQFEEGRANLRAIADEATRTGAEMEGLARFVGVVNHQLGDTAPSAQRLFDIMAEQGLQGALTPEQLAGDFGGMFGQFTQMSGLRGEEAVRQFGAMANALKTKDMSSSETATLMQNLFTALGNSPTRDALLEATGGHSVGSGTSRHVEGGTTALRADGTIDFAQLVEDMSRVEGIGTSDVVFHDTQARQAAGQLVALAQRDRAGEDVVTMAELTAADAEHGAALRAGNLETVLGTSAMGSRRLAVAGEVEGIQSLDSRIGSAQSTNAFNEAVTATGAEDIQAMVRWIPGIGEWLATSGLQQASQWMSENARSQQHQEFVGRYGDSMQSDLERRMIALGDATTRGQITASEPARPQKMADGARVELGAATVAALASALRAPTAPTDGRTPSEPRR